MFDYEIHEVFVSVPSHTGNITSLISLYEGRNNLNGGPILSFANDAWVDPRFILKSFFAGIDKGLYKAQVEFVNNVCSIPLIFLLLFSVLFFELTFLYLII